MGKHKAFSQGSVSNYSTGFWVVVFGIFKKNGKIFG
jgi:hypothetical protein